LYLLGRKLWDRRIAFAGAALLTVSYHHVWFSQNARGYSALLLFAVWSTWLWLEAVDRDEPRLWAGYALTLVLGLGFHLTMIFVIAAQGLVWLGSLARRRSIPVRGPLLAWLFGATFTLQIYALALPEFFSTALHETSMDSEWTRPLWVIAETIRNLQVGWSGGAVAALGGVVLAA
jgi:mannosyltransferase